VAGPEGAGARDRFGSIPGRQAGGGNHFLNLKIVKSQRRPNDIHDGIQSPYFVEMHFLKFEAVNFAFHLSQSFENGQAVFFDRVGNLAFLN